MFDDRPYRQTRSPRFSVWWFVGLMSCGLTAWHLELIPLLTSETNPQTMTDHAAPADVSEDLLSANRTSVFAPVGTKNLPHAAQTSTMPSSDRDPLARPVRQNRRRTD